ncbi:MAG: serine/threonine-protein kinase [Planctomycetota bacterium]|nr:serine/threonine-protein kinase [Planctomycetota bacterium]
MLFELRFVHGVRAGQVINLDDNQTVVLGRGTETNCRIQDPSISRRHCQITNCPQGLLIADLGSSNGTYVNGQPISHWVALNSGDQVVLGQNQVEIHAAMMVQQHLCTSCGREFMPMELTQGRFSRDPSGRLICTDCMSKFDFDPHMIEGYVVESKLGQGAFGAVFRAVQQQTGQVVALKTVRPQLVQSERDIARFFREAKAGAALVHPNIIRIYDAGESRGCYYIAMEYVEGKEIGKLIEEYGQINIGYTLRVGIQIANALQHAYERSIVHRDIKPDNILVTAQGQAKLVDFGLAKNFQSAGVSGLTAPGEGMGTLAYMPPEQLDNALMADQRSDIYSLGASLYHMLTGKRPFNEKTTRKFIMKILNKMPDPIRDHNQSVPPDLEEIIEKAMAKEPEDRYEIPEDFERDLKDLFEQMARNHGGT